MRELKAPLDVGFEITGRCSLRCRYCYAHRAARAFVPLAEASRVADELASLGVFSLSIEGGEPLLHPHWAEIAGLFIDAGMDVAVLTNGTVCDGKVVTSLKSLSSKSRFFCVQVSLDSIDPIVNNMTRGMGDLVVGNIHRLAESGLEVAVGTVVTTCNIDHVIDTITALRASVHRFHLMNLMPIPQAREDYSRLLPTEMDLAQFWSQIKIFADANPDLYISTPGTVPNLHFKPGSFQCQGCVAGTTRATITPDLLLIPCGLCPDWVMGDLRTQTFSEAWESHMSKIVRALQEPPCGLPPESVPRLEPNNAAPPGRKNGLTNPTAVTSSYRTLSGYSIAVSARRCTTSPE